MKRDEAKGGVCGSLAMIVVLGRGGVGIANKRAGRGLGQNDTSSSVDTRKNKFPFNDL